jgi:hypothetical protein
VFADLEVVHGIGAKLDALGIPWVIGGSVASSLLGEPRATADVDLVTDLRGVHVRELCRSIADLGTQARDNGLDELLRKLIAEREPF